MSYGQAPQACRNYKFWPANPGLCGICAWPEAGHERKAMQPHQERVVKEKAELDEKLGKLHAFCFGHDTKIFGSLSPEERDRLERQYDAMKLYSNILAERIAAF